MKLFYKISNELNLYCVKRNDVTRSVRSGHRAHKNKAELAINCSKTS